MTYYLYEDGNDMGTVHEGSCSDCNHGAGQGVGIEKPDTLSPGWSGPYETLSIAQAQVSHLRDAKCCGHCLDGAWLRRHGQDC